MPSTLIELRPFLRHAAMLFLVDNNCGSLATLIQFTNEHSKEYEENPNFIRDLIRSAIDLGILKPNGAGDLAFTNPILQDYFAEDALIVEIDGKNYGGDKPRQFARELARINTEAALAALIRASDNEE